MQDIIMATLALSGIIRAIAYVQTFFSCTRASSLPLKNSLVTFLPHPAALILFLLGQAMPE